MVEDIRSDDKSIAKEQDEKKHTFNILQKHATDDTTAYWELD